MHTNNASQPRTHVPRTQRGESKQVDELCDVDVAAAGADALLACVGVVCVRVVVVLVVEQENSFHVHRYAVLYI